MITYENELIYLRRDGKQGRSIILSPFLQFAPSAANPAQEEARDDDGGHQNGHHTS